MEAPASREALPGSTESRRLLTLELLIGLASAAAALALFTWLGREILEGEVIAFDLRIRDLVHGFASPRLTSFMLAASFFAGPGVLVPAGLFAAGAFLVKGWRRGALLALLLLAGSGLLNWLLKFSFARVRPASYFDYPLPGSPSFPSGHALFAASIFGGLAVLVTDRMENRWLQLLVWLIAVTLILLVGLSRVYLGVHYPSDVLAGYAVAVIWVTAIAVGDRLVRHRRRRVM
ncbi:MAG TPA: phosphatase PAP2 family protein [Gemmatimonadales bacterium]|nr:phosphatase PAP2 family protein [Gemmatimonadales bacterium]